MGQFICVFLPLYDGNSLCPPEAPPEMLNRRGADCRCS